MIEIPLSQGKIALVDDCDAHLLNYKWSLDSYGYAIRNLRKHEGSRKQVRLHHAVVGYPLKGLETDHKDTNPLNNCRENLRFVTHRENNQNKRCHKDGSKSSKFIGVRKVKNRWRSAIQIDGVIRHLGSFKNEIDAAEAYKKQLDLIALAV